MPAKGMTKGKTPRKVLERVCRMYATSRDAARAAGINATTFNRLCREYEIETPYQRKRRRHAAHQTR